MLFISPYFDNLTAVTGSNLQTQPVWSNFPKVPDACISFEIAEEASFIAAVAEEASFVAQIAEQASLAVVIAEEASFSAEVAPEAEKIFNLENCRS